jgi:hypothetical protein
MSKLRFLFLLVKGVFIILVTGYLLSITRSFLFTYFKVVIPDYLFQLMIAFFLFLSLSIGSGKFIGELKEIHKNKKDLNSHDGES